MKCWKCQVDFPAEMLHGGLCGLCAGGADRQAVDDTDSTRAEQAASEVIAQVQASFRHVDGMSAKPLYLWLGGTAAAIALAAVLFAAWKDARREELYLEAAAGCRNGLGIGKLAALDAAYGYDARPASVGAMTGFCEVGSALDRVERYRAILNPTD